MKWRGRRGSRNIEDRRGRGGRVAMGGGVGLVGMIAILAAGYFLGIDISPLVGGGGGTTGATLEASGNRQITAADKERGDFVTVVLADTEQVWADVFQRELGRSYRPPVLVLFTGATSSPCGSASGATGPFYCPGDRKAYLDTDFFVTMAKRMGAGGDFAAAYVVAHEIAHHVQNELGILGQANKARSRMNKTDSNRVSVMIELQADCLSGIWAREAQQKFGILEEGDLEEAINAAKQIGDDTIQRNAGRRPMPHTFTHGTSQQRMEWFARGLRSGEISACDTFSALN